ncbi:MAG: hypothetical protein LBS81_04695 [Endomicrobium sp.]|jgi:hypothetical protein|nr:hypothetical protein [Endomicrobium sp.]
MKIESRGIINLKEGSGLTAKTINIEREAAINMVNGKSSAITVIGCGANKNGSI